MQDCYPNHYKEPATPGVNDVKKQQSGLHLYMPLVSFLAGTPTIMQLIFAVAAIASVAAGFQSVISEKQFSQEFLDNYSILKHYGGNGPYSSRRSYGISREPPDSCSVDQVILIMRHGERYPSPDLGASIEAALAKIKSSNVSTYQGDLAFLNSWTYYVPNHCAYNAETSTGPYAGLLEAFKRGGDYRARYGHLRDGKSIVPIFAAGYQRIIATARKFGEGFFAANYSTNAAINIIPEAKEMGANSLTPTCDHDNDTSTCNSLTTVWPQFKVAAARLSSQNPGLDLNATDIYYLMCMYSPSYPASIAVWKTYWSQPWLLLN